MEYNGLNRGLNSNPAGLYVYRKGQRYGNTTPAGVEQPGICLYYKHVMPPASLLPPKNRGRLLTSVNENWSLDLLPLTSVNGKETASLTPGLQPHSMWLKPFPQMNSANRQLPACRTGRKQTAIKQQQASEIPANRKRETNEECRNETSKE